MTVLSNIFQNWLIQGARNYLVSGSEAFNYLH